MKTGHAVGGDAMINHSDAYTRKCAMIDRSVCKACGKPNDRQHDGNLGGLHCHACRNERRRVAEYARRDARKAVLNAHGEVICTYCHVRGVKPGALNPATGKQARRCETCLSDRVTVDRELASTRQRLMLSAMKVPGEFCGGRCSLRGPHECIEPSQTRQLSFENMRGA